MCVAPLLRVCGRKKRDSGGEGYGVAEQRMAKKTRGEEKKKTKPGENVISRAGRGGGEKNSQ